MVFFRFHASPNPRSKPGAPSAHAQAAFVNVWIDFSDQSGAEILARHYVEQAQWIAGYLEDVRCPVAEDYNDDPQLLSYYNEARANGYCLAFYIYSP
jgi:hypothetical protein